MLTWSHRHAYALLMRLDKPVGTYLLLWPTFWALWLASDGWPGWHLLIVFSLGVFLMRSAGCVINDFADRNFDGHVKRTSERPLPAGLVSAKEAVSLFILLSLIAFLLVLTLDWMTVAMSVPAVLLAMIYPFTKRITQLPQLVLGVAFSWGIPMVYMAAKGQVTPDAWWLFFANIVWTLGYDTKYAMVDRDDDVHIGVKSTAILFAQYDRLAVAACQLLTLIALVFAGHELQLAWPFYLGVGIAALMFGYQQWLIKDRIREKCFLAFKHNHWVGLVIFLAVLLAQFVQ